jgi:hypothetical protein
MASFAIEKLVAPVLRSHGYSKSGRTWHKTCDAAVLVVNLQKSYDVVYVNLGVCIRDMDVAEKPAINQCHIYFRLERVCPSAYFEAVRSASAEGASQEFVEAFERFGLAWLDSLSTRDGVQGFLRSSPLRRGMITRVAWSWAGVPCSTA